MLSLFALLHRTRLFQGNDSLINSNIMDENLTFLYCLYAFLIKDAAIEIILGITSFCMDKLIYCNLYKWHVLSDQPGWCEALHRTVRRGRPCPGGALGKPPPPPPPLPCLRPAGLLLPGVCSVHACAHRTSQRRGWLCTSARESSG